MHLLIWLVVMMVGYSAQAAITSIEISRSDKQYRILNQLELFCDTTNDLTIMDVSAASFQHNFQQASSIQIDHNYQYSNWVKITVSDKSTNHENNWMLESWGFDLDEIEFYSLDSGIYIKKASLGYVKPFGERLIFAKNPVFPLNIKPGETVVYYLRVKRHIPFHLSLVVQSQQKFIKHLSYEYWYLGLFYGIFIFLATVSILIFLFLWDRLYLFYWFCVVSELLYCLRRDGLGFQFFWPDFPFFNYLLESNIPQLLFVVASVLFAIHFLELKERNSFWYKISIYTIVMRCIVFLGIQFTPYQNENIFAVDFVFLLVPYIAGIILWRKKHPYAAFYVVAYSCLFLSFILIVLEANALLPFNVINWYWINIGMLLEVLFLALALASHIRFLRVQKEESNRLLVENLNEKFQIQERMSTELEMKVQERTDEIRKMLLERESQNEALKNANQELEQLNEKVKQMNELLNQDNQKLRSDVTELGQSRVLLKDMSFDEFKRFFPDDSSCLKYLAEQKWNKGYKCKKCGYNKGNTDENRFGIRCKNCNYLESPTAGTLFHKLKFPLTKAFYLMYLIYLKGKSISLDELSELLDLRRETCWSFRKKIMEAQQEFSKKGIHQSEHGWASIVLDFQPHQE